MDRRRLMASWTPLLFLLLVDKGYRHGVSAKGNLIIHIWFEQTSYIIKKILPFEPKKMRSAVLSITKRWLYITSLTVPFWNVSIKYEKKNNKKLHRIFNVGTYCYLYRFNNLFSLKKQFTFGIYRWGTNKI